MLVRQRGKRYLGRYSLYQRFRLRRQEIIITAMVFQPFFFSSQVQKEKIIERGIYSRYQVDEYYSDLSKRKAAHTDTVRM